MIVDAHWTTTVNYLTIECSCGRKWQHRSDRWSLVCPQCGKVNYLGTLREKWMNAQKQQVKQSEPEYAEDYPA